MQLPLTRVLVLYVLLWLQLTVILPCWDSFATESLKDRLPESLWELPAVKRAGLHMSLVWAVLLTLCTFVTLVSRTWQRLTAAAHCGAHPEQQQGPAGFRQPGKLQHAWLAQQAVWLAVCQHRIHMLFSG